MNYDIKKNGERIRQLRIKNGLTQEQAAGVLNIDIVFSQYLAQPAITGIQLAHCLERCL